MKNILPQFRFMTMIFLFHKLIGHNNIMGSNRGFEQELEVINELNDKFFSDVSPKYKHLMKNIGFNIKNNTKISCQKKEGASLEKKRDLVIEAESKSVNISVKRGSQNSIHQENIYRFINFLDGFSKLEESEKELILEFHWCDGTINNTGKVKDRMPKANYRRQNTETYSQYMTLLNKYKEPIFYRAWIGTTNKPDYLVHFIKNEIRCYDFSELLDYHLAYDDENTIGILRMQNCWACLQGQDCSHITHVCDSSCPKPKGHTVKHRQDIQFKSIAIEGIAL